jgi:predicted SAM-dependent methyltransferase
LPNPEVSQTDIALSDEKRRKLLIPTASPRGLRRKRVQKLIGDLIRNRKIQMMRLTRYGNNLPQFLHVGCGPTNLYKEFINTDYKWVPGIDLCWDFTKQFPFPDHTFKGIFAEQTIEHVLVDAFITKVLPEFKRLLKSGGVIRIVTNDGDALIDRYYQAKLRGELEQPINKVSLEKGRVPSNSTMMMNLNAQFRSWGHKFIYDYQTLASALQWAGFVDVRHETFMHGQMPELLIDSSDWVERHTLLMYVEAFAP